MTKTKWRDAAAGLIVPLVLILLWQAVCLLGWINPLKLPSPFAVAQRWVQYLLPVDPYTGSGSWLSWAFSGELVGDAIGSMVRVAMGFAVGAGLALPLGLLMGASQRVYGKMYILVQVLRPIPPSAYTPLAMLWFGLGNPPAVFMISIAAFFPVLINTIVGVRQVDSIYLRAARNLGVSHATMFVRVMLPAAMPYILAGVRIAIGASFMIVIVSELIAVPDGLGFRINEAREYFWTDKVMAGMFTIGMIGLALDLIMNKLNNHLLRWHRGLES
ncbi:MAG TPA: sulfonate ABC transporter permease [Oxalobacteraceae bacterium]|jgi:NitT/TauT family transport system permease protein|nr:sulfonate ABC transporter permease [Oxalobacteraceae bacterium]